MRRGQPNAAHFHRTYSRPLIKRHMILVGYQRSIRQICRSPYIETTISLPFVGMIGRSLPLLVPGMPIFDFAKWFEILASAKPCEALRHNRTQAPRSKRPAASISIFRGAEVPRTVLLIKVFRRQRLRCGEISELNSVAHAGDTRLVVRGRWLSTLAKSRQEILARAIGTFQPSALGASASRGPGSRASSRKASRPSGFDPFCNPIPAVKCGRSPEFSFSWLPLVETVPE
jgi:hypothetical protein